jgi:hypothetical protein
LQSVKQAFELGFSIKERCPEQWVSLSFGAQIWFGRIEKQFAAPKESTNKVRTLLST